MSLLLALCLAAPADLTAAIDALGAKAVEKEALGLAVAVRTPDATVVRGFGKVRFYDDAVPDGDTVFEIGSISKVFTGVLLADAVERGVMKLDDPITRHVPKGVAVCADEAPILLRHLTTHTSGLPRMPSNFAPATMEDPYVDYGDPLLYGFLGDFVLESDPGDLYAYSNLAVGLLGQLVARANGQPSYEAALRARILEPLALADTTVKVTDELRPRFAAAAGPGHRPVKPWEFDALVGCGGIRGTVNDLIRFGVANLEPDDSPIGAALRRSHEVLHEGPPKVAYGWHLADGGRLLWHNGQTGGYHGWLSVDRAAGVVVAILSNGHAGSRIDKAGLELSKLARGD